MIKKSPRLAVHWTGEWVKQQLQSICADTEAVEPVDVESTGFIPLNDQLAAEIAARDHYGSRLVSMLQSV